MVMMSPFLSVMPSGTHGARPVVDAERAGARDAGLAHAARHHRGVRGHAAPRGQNAFGGMHAVNIFRAGFDPDQDDPAVHRLQPLGLVGIEDDFAGGRARRGRAGRLP